MEVLECKNCGDMLVYNIGRWELAVANDVYVRNGSRRNIGVQTYNTYQYSKKKFPAV